MYFPLDDISPTDFSRKVQQLGTDAQVKTARTRTVLKQMLKQYKNLFMTKGMAIQGTVKTQHHIDLKDGYRVQHYLPQRLGEKQKEVQEEEVKKLCNMG